MESESDTLEALRQQAALLIQRPDDQEARARFEALLAACDDRSALEALTEKLAFYPEVAVPLVERLVRFDPSDVVTILRLGFIHFSAGEDEAAARCLEQAKTLEGETARVLQLEAAMARTDAEKKRLYTKILMLEPGNRDVFLHLISLRK